MLSSRELDRDELEHLLSRLDGEHDDDAPCDDVPDAWHDAWKEYGDGEEC